MKQDQNELWEQFLGGPDGGLCGLCGQTGVIDTRDEMMSPAGVYCGVRRWCICPNGRAGFEQTGGQQPLGLEERIAKIEKLLEGSPPTSRVQRARYFCHHCNVSHSSGDRCPKR